MSTITDPRQTIAGRLRAARQFASIEQAEIAEQLGVARQTVSAWENGRAELPASMLIRWAEATRISLDWIAWGNVRPEGFEPPAYCSVADAGQSEAYCWLHYCTHFYEAHCDESCPLRADVTADDVHELVLAA